MKKTAKDIMTPGPKYIASGEDLRAATQLFFENNIHYAPVLTPNKEVLGLLSEMGLVKASLKQYLEPNLHDKVVHHKDVFEPAVFVEESASLDDVVKALFRSPCNRILVQNKQGALVGIIAPKDILSLVSGQQRKSTNLKDELEKTRTEAVQLTTKVTDLEQSLKVYRNIFEDSPYMMHSIDNNGKIIMANKRIHEVLGYSQPDLIGKSLADLYPKSVLHEAMHGLQEIKSKGMHHVTYTTMMRKNGEKLRIDIASSALRSASGDFLGTISISREVDAEELLRALHGISDPAKVRAINNGD
jgi:PAS domain S-box-containing protein